MAKGRKKNTKRGNRAAKRTTAPPTAVAADKPAEPTPAEDMTRVEEAAMADATEADMEAVESAPAPDKGASAEDMIMRAVEALALLEAQRKRSEAAEEAAKAKEAELEDSRKALQDDREALDLELSELGEKSTALDEREQAVVKSEAGFLKKEEGLVLHELDADAGFAERNREALAQLEKEAEDLRARFSGHRSKIAEERTSWEEEVQQKRSELQAELTAQRTAAGKVAEETLADIETERGALKDEQKRIRKEKRNSETDRELLEEDREAFDEKVAQRAARTIEDKDGEIQALQDRLESAREERNRLSQQIADREEADRRFGNQTPEQVLKQLRDLQKERDKLQKALGGRPSAEAAQRLEDLERERELWQADQLKLMADLSEAEQNAARKRIAVTEMESLRDEKRSLDSANALLHKANRQLRAEVDALVKGAEGKSPFPSCSDMDSDNELQSSRPTTDTIRSLEDFAHYVRHRMAWDPKTEKELHYSAEDVRSFLGGLAMSRLHLLQGISGTGKTSLPLAFARAIGAGSALVEVQAGWRDRQDLIGHFNTFERRFYESEFLQALYRAKTPQYRDTPFIVILDEMNLSHPEQYFADLLSALEQDPHRRRLVLMTAAVDPAPKLLIEGGTKLPLPPNVWFVGTANHDETTKDFADKTYDRAHVMELPRNRKAFTREEFQPQQPVSMAALQQAFDGARETHGREAGQAYSFLEQRLGGILGRRFRVGWGNRLERQMGFFVPVVVAAGGSVGEATDHILATKLLRKIRDRHDNRPEDIIALRDHVQTEWKKLDRDAGPVRSVELLNQELRRLGHDDE